MMTPMVVYGVVALLGPPLTSAFLAHLFADLVGQSKPMEVDPTAFRLLSGHRSPDSHHWNRQGVVGISLEGSGPGKKQALDVRAQDPTDRGRSSHPGRHSSLHLRSDDGDASTQVRRLTVLGLISVPNVQADARGHGSPITTATAR